MGKFVCVLYILKQVDDFVLEAVTLKKLKKIRVGRNSSKALIITIISNY